MFDSDQRSPSWLMRAAAVLIAALAGVVLGVATFWAKSLGSVDLPLARVDLGSMMPGIMVIAAGVAAAFKKPSLPLVTVGATAMLITSTLIGQLASRDSILGFIYGMVYTSCFLVAMLVVAVRRARRSYVQRGWDLAFAEAREHEARMEQALRRERDAMASEIHDGLGHRLTLIAVQAARLSLDEQLPAEARAEMQSIRANAAAAADELGETVQLLAERTSDVTASLSGLSIQEVIERAQSSGVTVRSTIALNIEGVTNDYTQAALLRVLQEGLTNAAKHAPGAEVNIAIDIVATEVVLRMRNPMPQPRSSGPTGHGIDGLQHRVAILGGTFEVERGEDFVVTVRLPCSAMPSSTAAHPQSSRIGILTAEAAGAKRRSRRAMQQAWLVPLAMFFILAVVAIGYFVDVTVASVLPPERFAAIEIGDTRAEAELLLPSKEMLDAPRSVVPEPPDSTCVYYEASVSFFERDDVFQICFADDQVVSTMIIPPGY